MIRVALVIAQFPSPEHPYIAEWVRALDAANIELTIFTERIPSQQLYPHLFEDTDLWQRVQLISRLQNPMQSIRRNAGQTLWAVGQQARLLRVLRGQFKATTVLRKWYEYAPFADERYDIVHLNAPQIGVRRLELAQIFESRVLVSFRGQDFSFHPDRYDRILQEADHLHFISEFLVGEAAQRGYARDKHTLIPPMVDLDFFHPPSTALARFQGDDEPFWIVSAARFFWTKGWEFALQAVALLVERGFNVRYVIAGRGEFEEAILYTIAELGLTDRVEVLGWVSPETLRDWFWQADVYVLTSVEEGFNNSVLQAQACGTPVVCSDAGGLPENIVDGETGLLARRRDAWDTADKLAYLLTHPAERAQMGQRASERVQRDFGLQRLVHDFVGLYERMLRQ